MSDPSGYVYLIGAGCGLADLITVRGLRLLQSCDVVVYDDLIDQELLRSLPDTVERLYMGKRQGHHSATQQEISSTLVQLAQQGRRVARLKGGDPFVFGRGGEELLALQKANVPYEEVPGITSAIAIPAQAGIPVTHRGLSQSLHIITAHTANTPDGLPEDLDRLASLRGTLVFLMGLSRLEILIERLIQGGKPLSTPAAVLSGGCSAHPAVVRGTLADLAQKTRQAQVLPPAIIMVGEVAALDLTNQSPRPLEGVRVGLTGTPAIQKKLEGLLLAKGAQVHQVMESVVEPVPTTWSPTQLFDGAPHWLVFTSVNGVAMFSQQIHRDRLDLRRFSHCKFAVIGPATGEALSQLGIQPDLCPDTYTSQGLAQALCQAVAPGEDVYLLRSAQGVAMLPQQLREHGISTEDIPLYTTRSAPSPSPLPPVDYLLFSSAGGVKQFFSQYHTLPEGIGCVCIGPVTAQELKRHTSRPFLVAPSPSAHAMVETLCTIFIKY